MAKYYFRRGHGTPIGEHNNSQSMTRVIHTADTHIGYRQYHSSQRREDFLAAFEAVVEDAVDSSVDAVLHAGDLFHDRRPELEDLLGILSTLRTLDDAGIPFLAVVGNHESTRSGQWLDLFERLGLAVRLDDDPTVVGDVAFYGLDHVPESIRSDLEYTFTPHDAAHTALVAHGLFEPFAHGDWDTAELLEEATVPFEALLAGDNHKPDRAQVHDTWVTYPGSTERASAAEREARGYNLVTFGEGAPNGTVDIRRRTLETRPFEYVEVDLAPGEGATRVTERVREHELEDAVVIVEIDGEGEPVTPATVEEFATDHGALTVRVNDRREMDQEEDITVSFADPDAAVRERIDEMELSPTALEIDETVRESKLADSNIREQVRSRVEDQLDDLNGRVAPDAGDSVTTPADGGLENETTADVDADAGVNPDSDASSAPETSLESGTDPESGSESCPDEDTDTGSESDDSASTDDGSDDGQVSMEDYL